MNFSHTHSGPALRECLQDYYSWDDAARGRTTEYTLALERSIVDRTAEAMAVTGVLLPDRRAASITPAVVNASSGAVEHLRIAEIEKLDVQIEEGRIVAYRAKVKLSFKYEGED